jgi:hypothetical protein
MNSHGVAEKDIVISLPQHIISAENFINAIRHVKKTSAMVSVGIEDFSPSDLFVLQIAALLRDYGKGTEGTHATFPKDILEVIYPLTNSKSL